MLTKDEVQRAIDVLKKHKMVEETKPENRRPGEPVFYIPLTVKSWEIEPVVKKHPDLNEAFAFLAAAGDCSHLEEVMKLVLTYWDWKRKVDFYKTLPSGVLETDPPLGVNALVRNWAEWVFYGIDDEIAQMPGVSQALLEVYDHPPAVVLGGQGHGRDMHRLFWGAVVYPTLPVSDEAVRRRVLAESVDAAHSLVQNHETNPLDSSNALHYNIVAHSTEFLPIARAITSVSHFPVASGIETRYFWDLTGRKIHFGSAYEMDWTARLFESLFGAGLGALFESRQWDADAVRAVLRDGLQKLTAPTVYKPTLREIYKNGYKTTLTGLIESFGRVYPEYAGRFLWAAAHTVSSPKTALMFVEAATEKSVPGFVRDWARAHIAHAYRRGCSWVGRDPKRRVTSDEMMKQRGEVAKTLYSSVFGTDHSEARWYTPQMWTDLWDGFLQLIVDPSRLMGDAERMRVYRRALEEDLKHQFCHDMADKQRR